MVSAFSHDLVNMVVWYLLEQWHNEYLMHQYDKMTINDQLFRRRKRIWFFGHHPLKSYDAPFLVSLVSPFSLLIDATHAVDKWLGFNHCVSTLAFLVRFFLHDCNIFCPPAPSLQLICAPLVWDQSLGAITLSRGCLAFASGIIAVWFGGFRENMIICFVNSQKHSLHQY